MCCLDPPPPSPPLPSLLSQTKLALELLQAEYQGETLARTAAEAKVEHLELQVKKLQADLHVSTFLVVHTIFERHM